MEIPLDSAATTRFWEKVRKGAGCWEWTAARTHNGYGVFSLTHTKQVRAHRVSYQLHHGPIPDAKPLVLHHCDNPPCVNPDHLFAGTQKDNIADMMDKGRGPYRYRGRSRVLTQEEIAEAQRLYDSGMSQSEVADRLDVTQKTISNWTQARPWEKLTAADADEIRQRYAAGGVSQQALADEHGVSQPHISRIIRGENHTWTGR